MVGDNVGNGQNLHWKSHEYTNPGANFVTVAVNHQFSLMWFIATAQLLPTFLSRAKRQNLIVFRNAKAEFLKQIAKWMGEGKIKSVIDSNYRFDKLRQAYQRLNTGRAKGKTVVKVAPEEECTT